MRIIDDEKVNQILHQFQSRVNDNNFTKLDKLIEHSFFSIINRELTRLNAQQYQIYINQTFDDFKLYNIENIYKVGIKKNRNLNRILDIAQTQMNIQGNQFTTIFKKRQDRDDIATLSVFLDISFRSKGEFIIKGQGNEISNRSSEYQYHSIRFESDIYQSNYKSVKQEDINLEGLKVLEPNLIIIDIDNFLVGNPYYQRRK
ncbi:hypothetical protein pb186bvf_006202 [Paramecium bursaria]